MEKITKKQFQDLHGLTDEEMDFIDFLKKESKGKVFSVSDKPVAQLWAERKKKLTTSQLPS